MRDMSIVSEATNKALVLVALDTLFNKRDYCVAEQYWSPASFSTVRTLRRSRWLFEFVKTAPGTLRYEPGVIVANEDYVIVHGRISGNGRPRNWIVATILRMRTGVLLSSGRWFKKKRRKWNPRVDIRCLATGLSIEGVKPSPSIAASGAWFRSGDLTEAPEWNPGSLQHFTTFALACLRHRCVMERQGTLPSALAPRGEPRDCNFI